MTGIEPRPIKNGEKAPCGKTSKRRITADALKLKALELAYIHHKLRDNMPHVYEVQGYAVEISAPISYTTQNLNYLGGWVAPERIEIRIHLSMKHLRTNWFSVSPAEVAEYILSRDVIAD